jgi:hypothetical protein
MLEYHLERWQSEMLEEAQWPIPLSRLEMISETSHNVHFVCLS